MPCLEKNPLSSPCTVGVTRLTPASGVDSIFIEDRTAIAHYGFQISTVAAFYQWTCECQNLLCIDVSLSVGNLLQTGNFEALTLLYDTNEIPGVQ